MDVLVLAVALWAGAAGGVAAIVVAVAVPSRRRAALIVAALLFLPIGILGILSIGIFFVVAAIGCLVAAVTTSGRQTSADPSPPT